MSNSNFTEEFIKQHIWMHPALLDSVKDYGDKAVSFFASRLREEVEKIIQRNNELCKKENHPETEGNECQRVYGNDNLEEVLSLLPPKEEEKEL